MAEQSRERKAQTRYQELIQLRDEERSRVAGSTVCVKGQELSWEMNPQGLMKWYMHPNIDLTAHKFLIFYAQKIPPADRKSVV